MIKILLLMILCHIIDDFVLQPVCLSKLKQKSWWKENVPDTKYENDYIAALLIHSLSWGIMIILPIMFLSPNVEGYQLLCTVVINALFHSWIDDAKANYKVINLEQDQLLHLIQIIITFIFLVVL